MTQAEAEALVAEVVADCEIPEGAIDQVAAGLVVQSMVAGLEFFATLSERLAPGSELEGGG